MATAHISQEFAEGGAIQVDVEVDDTFPDSVREVCVQAMVLWRETFCSEVEA